MVTITVYMRQQKRHWCIEQSFGLCGRGRGWDDFGEWHWNTYNIIYGMSHQSSFDAWYFMLGPGALGRPRGMVWGGRREEGSGWGTLVYLWQIHFDIWQNQYNIAKFKKKKLISWHLFPSLHGKWMGKQWKQWQTSIWGAQKSLQMVTPARKLNPRFPEVKVHALPSTSFCFSSYSFFFFLLKKNFF